MHRPGCNKYLKIKHFSFIECLDFDEDIQSYPHDWYPKIWNDLGNYQSVLCLSDPFWGHGKTWNILELRQYHEDSWNIMQ